MMQAASKFGCRSDIRGDALLSMGVDYGSDKEMAPRALPQFVQRNETDQ